MTKINRKDKNNQQKQKTKINTMTKSKRKLNPFKKELRDQRAIYLILFTIHTKPGIEEIKYLRRAITLKLQKPTQRGRLI